MRAGGAIGGVRILTGSDSCAACQSLAGTVFDPDHVPEMPVAGCTAPRGCRCAFTHVMMYELARLAVDHHPKPVDYSKSVLARLRLAGRAGGAIRGIRIVVAPDGCTACRELDGVACQSEQAPIIPNVRCINRQGCRCAYLPTEAYEI
jgi:hypothetical protein